jgi:hypothetical protein
MRVNDAIDIRPCFVNFGMDENFAVSSATAINFHTLHVAHHDVLHCDFIESMAMRLHDEEGRVLGGSNGHMAPRQIALTRIFQNVPRINQALFEFVQVHGVVAL